MRVLVTGGAGFLGRHFVAHHVARGDEVIIVDDLSASGAVVPADATCEFVALDVLDYCERAEDRFDLAYHFAAPVGGRVKIEQDPLFNARSLAIDAQFFRWAVLHVKQVVYPSSSAVYGTQFQEAGQHRALQEGMFHPGNPTWYRPDEMYGFTKLAGEILAEKASRYGLSTLCIRPFSGYGEGQSFEYPIPSIARRAVLQEDPLVIWGSGRQTRDLIHVEDIVRLTRERISYGVMGYDNLNLGSGIPTTFRRVAEICAEIVGYSPEIASDDTKPEGVSHRYAGTGKLEQLGGPRIATYEGLRRVITDVRHRLESDM